jgi:hypothetical protein
MKSWLVDVAGLRCESHEARYSHDRTISAHSRIAIRSGRSGVWLNQVEGWAHGIRSSDFSVAGSKQGFKALQPRHGTFIRFTKTPGLVRLMVRTDPVLSRKGNDEHCTQEQIRILVKGRFYVSRRV